MNKASITIIYSLLILFIGVSVTSWAQTQSENGEAQEVIFDVLFGLDNNDLSPETKDQLNRHAETLINNPGTIAVLEGYSDSRGDDNYNTELSKKRAETVMEYLVSRGVPPENLSVDPIGGTDRFSKGDTEEALASNRRVRVTYVLPLVDQDEVNRAQVIEG